jgi:hypothetical protein
VSLWEGVGVSLGGVGVSLGVLVSDLGWRVSLSGGGLSEPGWGVSLSGRWLSDSWRRASQGEGGQRFEAISGPKGRARGKVRGLEGAVKFV